VNKPKWSPGPWDISIGTQVGLPGTPDVSVAILRADATAHAIFRGPYHVENGTLAAAAPDLYDALESLAVVAGAFEWEYVNPHGDVSTYRSVLARARGDAS
jgi:hypothetical protein